MNKLREPAANPREAVQKLDELDSLLDRLLELPLPGEAAAGNKHAVPEDQPPIIPLPLEMPPAPPVGTENAPAPETTDAARPEPAPLAKKAAEDLRGEPESSATEPKSGLPVTTGGAAPATAATSPERLQPAEEAKPQPEPRTIPSISLEADRPRSGTGPLRIVLALQGRFDRLLGAATARWLRPVLGWSGLVLLLLAALLAAHRLLGLAW